MTKKLHISRDGAGLGEWPYDVVVSLFRHSTFLPTDHFWTEGMESWEPVTTIIPPPLSEATDYLRGRNDDEDEWAFYSRDGSTVVGPRSVAEIGSMVDGAFLSDESLIFLPAIGRWMTVGELAQFEPPVDTTSAPAETSA